MTDEELYLRLVHEYAARVLEDAGKGKSQYLAALGRREVVFDNLCALSRYTQRLPQTIKDAHPEVGWGHVAVLQGVMEMPLGFDRERVWEVVQEDVPQVKRAATAALTEL